MQISAYSVRIAAILLFTGIWASAQNARFQDGRGSGQMLDKRSESQAGGGASSRAAQDARYGEIPLAFEPNKGQAPPNVRFVSRARGLSVLIEDRKATLIAGGKGSDGQIGWAELSLSLAGGAWSQLPMASDRQESVSNYLIGKDPKAWHTGVANFGRVRYEGVYPGVNLVFYGNHRKLEHDFEVGAGVDYHQIRVRLDGASELGVGR